MAISVQINKVLLDQVKKKVLKEKLSDEEAMKVIAEKLGMFSDSEHTEEFKKFCSITNDIYKDEPESGISYKMASGVSYTYPKASEGYKNFMFKIFKELLSDEIKKSLAAGSLRSLDLKAKMWGALRTKEVLELGCGRGFNLRVLKSLGARVHGIESLPIGPWCADVDIKHDDAENIDQLFPEKKFDIIYAKDLFCEAIIDINKAARIFRKLHDHLNHDGMIISQVTYKKIEPEMQLMALWLWCRRTGENYQEHEQSLLEQLQNKNLPTYSNRAYHFMDPNFIINEEIENGELTITAKKLPEQVKA